MIEVDLPDKDLVRLAVHGMSDADALDLVVKLSRDECGWLPKDLLALLIEAMTDDEAATLVDLMDDGCTAERAAMRPWINAGRRLYAVAPTWADGPTAKE